MSDLPKIADGSMENESDTQFRLAQVWENRKLWQQALNSYKKVVQFDPDHARARLRLGKTLETLGRREEAIESYRESLGVLPNESELHKAFVNALEENGSTDEILEHYRLERISSRDVQPNENALICCFVCRNESARLPYFLEYYRGLGVDEFFAIDNGSTDGTTEFLKSQSDVHIWISDLSFNQANFGSAWFEVVLRAHARGRWCITVDVDELLYFPDCERVSLPEYCKQLESAGKRVLPTVLLELYSSDAVDDTRYEAGTDFRGTCSYFDREFYHKRIEDSGPYGNQTYYFGGVRERVFGASDAFCQSKVSVIKYDTDCVLAGGQHWTNLDRELIAGSRGCLLHFKYFSDFDSRVKEEVNREEHYADALQYKQYVSRLDDEGNPLSLFDPSHSLKLESSQQLVELGIMKVDIQGADPDAELIVPKIALVEYRGVRPVWSVIVTVYNRTTHLERCLESILQQDMGEGRMEIEVVRDAGPADLAAEIQEIVVRVGKGRVGFHEVSERKGHPHIFNYCIERAKGEWIHIVHDDDWLAPGYYEALAKGIESTPELGAAFCRYTLMGPRGERKWVSDLERKTPGVVVDWLERIGIYCRLAFSSMAVKRSVFESVGGFSPSVGSAFDWDMWKRVAVGHPVWFEPRALSYCGREGDSLTDELMLTGEQIADSLLSIKYSESYLPAERSRAISANARAHYADYALSLARRHLQAKNFEAAVQNIVQGLEASRSEAIRKKLLSIFIR